MIQTRQTLYKQKQETQAVFFCFAIPRHDFYLAFFNNKKSFRLMNIQGRKSKIGALGHSSYQ